MHCHESNNFTIPGIPVSLVERWRRARINGMKISDSSGMDSTMEQAQLTVCASNLLASPELWVRHSKLVRLVLENEELD